MKQSTWKFLLVAMLVLGALVFSGCGGSGALTPTLPPLPTFVAGSVTEPDRTRAIGEVNAFYQTVVGQADAIDQVVTYMKTRPEIITAEKSRSGDAVAFFKDGRMHVVLQPTPQPAAPLANSRAIAPEPTAPTTRELPGANKAYLINVDDGSRFDVIPSIDPDLTIRGYDTVVLDGFVTDFAQIQNAGVLYLKTIGFLSRNEFDNEQNWFVTATPSNDETTALYQTQLDNGSMCTTYVAEWTPDGRIFSIRIAVSDEFIESSGMSFTSNAIWINEAAYGGNQRMKNVALNFDGVKAYWSWTGRSYEEDAAGSTIFLFARFLGNYDDKQGDTAFGVSFALSDTLRISGGAVSYAGTTFPGNSRFALYAREGESSAELTMIPSIRSATVDKTESTMTIEGYFGSVPGAVTINGSTLNVRSWTPKKVIVDAPTVTEGGIVLRSLGGASASGQLSSKLFDWEDLVFKINPEDITLKKNETRSFAVTATGGTVPTGTKYKWTLEGQGKINGTTVVNSTATSVSYKAANSDGESFLKVEVFTPSGGKLGEALARIGIGDNVINYTSSGNTNYPNLNGTFTHADGIGAVFTQQGLDQYEFGYNIDTASGYARVLVFLTVPANTVLAAGQTYNDSTNLETGFSFGTTESLTGPTNGQILNYGGDGTLTITSATSNPDGTKSIGYTFNLVGATQGTGTSGTGSIVVGRDNPGP